jgi:predicted transcriptional regulator
MENSYKSLPYHLLNRGTALYKPTHSLQGGVTMDDPATLVMTDLAKVVPITIEQTATMNKANTKMITCGVRLLLVTNSNDTILGLVTASDILGEKPVKYLQRHGGSRDNILVQDVMTPQEKLDALKFSDIQNAKVGDIVETIQMFGRQHLLVIEENKDGSETVRGLFSTTQVGYQLGIEIALSSRAKTFAELGEALVAAF